MKTIETKISKSGATIYYVDGKRTSYENAMFVQRMNEREARWLANIEAEKAERIEAAMSEVNTTAEAIDVAAEAEIELAGNSDVIETKMTVSELREALKASRAKVQFHFTAKGNPTWQSTYHYGKNDIYVGTDRLTKREADERLAEFGLTANLVVEITKAVDEAQAAKTAVMKQSGEFYTGGRNCHKLTADEVNAVYAKFAKADEVKADTGKDVETSENVIEVKTFDSGRYTVKLNGKRISVEYFAEHNYDDAPNDAVIVLDGRKYRNRGSNNHGNAHYYNVFTDENGYGFSATTGHFSEALWSLGKGMTPIRDFSKELAQMAAKKKGCYYRFKVESESKSYDEHINVFTHEKSVDVFSLLPDVDELNDVDTDDTDEAESDNETVANEIDAAEYTVTEDAFNVAVDAENNAEKRVMRTALVKVSANVHKILRYDDYASQKEFAEELRGNGYKVLKIWNGNISDDEVSDWHFMNRNPRDAEVEFAVTENDEPATETVNGETETVNLDGITETNNDGEDGFTGEDFLNELTVTLDINAAVEKILATADNFRFLDQRHEISLKPDSEIMWERDFRGYKGDSSFLITEVYNHPDGTLREVYLRGDGLPVTVEIAEPNHNMKLAAKIVDGLNGTLEFLGGGFTKNGKPTVCFDVTNGSEISPMIRVTEAFTDETKSNLDYVEVTRDYAETKTEKRTRYYFATGNVDIDALTDLNGRCNDILKRRHNLNAKMRLLTNDEYAGKLAELDSEIRYGEVQIAAVKAGDTFDYVDAAEHIKSVYEDLQNCVEYWGDEHGLTPAQCEKIYVAAHIDRNFDSDVDRELINRMIGDFKHGNEMTAKLREVTDETGYMTIICQDGTERQLQHFKGAEVTVCNGYDFKSAWGVLFGHYDTPAQVNSITEMLKATVTCGDNKFTFLTVLKFFSTDA